MTHIHITAEVADADLQNYDLSDVKYEISDALHSLADQAHVGLDNLTITIN